MDTNEITNSLKRLDILESDISSIVNDMKKMQDRTLDLYNSGSLSKNMMEEMMKFGKQRIESGEKNLEDIAQLKVTVKKMLEDL